MANRVTPMSVGWTVGHKTFESSSAIGLLPMSAHETIYVDISLSPKVEIIGTIDFLK